MTILHIPTFLLGWTVHNVSVKVVDLLNSVNFVSNFRDFILLKGEILNSSLCKVCLKIVRNFLSFFSHFGPHYVFVGAKMLTYCFLKLFLLSIPYGSAWASFEILRCCNWQKNRMVRCLIVLRSYDFISLKMKVLLVHPNHIGIMCLSRHIGIRVCLFSVHRLVLGKYVAYTL